MSFPTNIRETRNELDLITPQRTGNSRRYNITELRQIARNLGLPTSGNKEVLANRICDYVENHQEEVVQDTFPIDSYIALLRQLYDFSI